MRRHTLILPTSIELLMGEATFKQQLAGFQQQGKILGESNPDYKMVQKIAKRIIGAVEEQRGGGFQKHVPKFKWEVVVVDSQQPNAFVLPGGKIVVFTALIQLMDRREDLLAAVIGHEVAHALARHSSEKLSLGLLVTLAANVGVALISSQRHQRGPGGPNQRRAPGAQGLPVSWGGRGQPTRGGYGGASPYGRRGMQGYNSPAAGGNPLLNPQVISIFANLFLQLPFSRRAEAEADLIGMKLMALAGYDPSMSPETFIKLGKAEAAMRKSMGGNLGALQCTHPRSDSRVQMLQEELALMQESGDGGLDQVLHKVPYWML
eukprot:jgi/Astpho2/3063/Aster-x0558